MRIVLKTLLEILFLFLFSYSFAGEGNNEKYEKSEVKSRDHTFHKFMKRISVCPEQILRYVDQLVVTGRYGAQTWIVSTSK